MCFNIISLGYKFGLKRVPKPAAFVIDENQDIIYAEVLESVKHLPDFAAIKTIIK